MKTMEKSFLLTTIIIAVCFCGTTVFAAKCLYVSSYHKGYAWSDGVEKGLLPELEGNCEIKTIEMDTKRNTSEEFKKQAALEAKTVIESFQPDVVIVSDDNAVKYLVVPYFKDNSLPFVFSGVNWSAEKYGLPFNNVTGMVEVSLFKPLLNVAKKVLPEVKKVFYLDADNTTGHKTLEHYQKFFKDNQVELEARLVKTFEEWKQGFLDGQEYDAIILENNSGISGWNEEEAARFATEHSKKYSMTVNDWMMPYSLIGMTKVAEEQGMWSGKTAVSILKGADPAKIKIVENRQSNIFVNSSLQQKIQIDLPASIMSQATIVK